MDKRTYTGITIGPIYDTMQLTSSPGGLWAASYLFSWVAKQLITELIRLGIPADQFISPAVGWDGEKEAVVLEPDGCDQAQGIGVGMFHDRIIFRGDELDKVKAARKNTIKKLAGRLPRSSVDWLSQFLRIQTAKAKVKAARKNTIEKLAGRLARPSVDWLSQFLRIQAAKADVPEDGNPILILGPVLDALELEPQYVPNQTGDDPLLYLFENLQEGAGGRGLSNEQLHKSQFVSELTKGWMLLDGKGGIRDLGHIASNGMQVEKKYQQYYAILKSDGDGMGKTLKKLRAKGNDLSGLHTFSKNCLQFCAKASQIIREYGCVPIYAGGDDLLAITPIVGDRGEQTLLTLIKSLRDCFNYIFQPKGKTEESPTISIGVAVQYYKSPLYEALERADSMLYAAKAAPGKNALRLDLQKHSGQSILLKIDRLDESDALCKLDKELIQALSYSDGSPVGEFLSGAGYQIERFHDLFRCAVRNDGKATLENLMNNLFDNVGQKAFRETYLSGIEDLSWSIIQESLKGADMTNSVVDDKFQDVVIRQIEGAIRLIRFMQEKADRRGKVMRS